MRAILVLLSVVCATSWADGLFERFIGDYRVENRWCQSADADCLGLTGLRIGYDHGEMKSFAVEQLKDGTSRTIWLWEGSTGKEEAFITGDFGQSASWTYQGEKETGKKTLTSVSLNRNAAALYYSFSENTIVDGKPVSNIKRRFKIRR